MIKLSYYYKEDINKEIHTIMLNSMQEVVNYLEWNKDKIEGFDAEKINSKKKMKNDTKELIFLSIVLIIIISIVLFNYFILGVRI